MIFALQKEGLNMCILYEWVKTIEKDNNQIDLNFTVSLSWIGMGINFTKGDFSWILTINLLITHFTILSYRKGI